MPWLTQNFDQVQSVQSWTVPERTDQVQVTLVGGQGGVPAAGGGRQGTIAEAGS